MLLWKLQNSVIWLETIKKLKKTMQALLIRMVFKKINDIFDTMSGDLQRFENILSIKRENVAEL